MVLGCVVRVFHSFPCHDSFLKNFFWTAAKLKLTIYIQVDQLEPSMFFFGPESARSRHPSSQPRKERSPSVPSQNGLASRRAARESSTNGIHPDAPGEVNSRRGRKPAVDAPERVNAQIAPDAVSRGLSVDGDRPNGVHAVTPGALSPTPGPSKEDVEVEGEVGEPMAGLTINEGSTGGSALSHDVLMEQDQEPLKLVTEDSAETPIITHTLTNGHSVEVQTTKVAELEMQHPILTVASDSHVTRTAWRPKYPGILAISGYDFCSALRYNENPSVGPKYLSLADNITVSAMAWEPRGAMLAVATYGDLSGELRIYHGEELVLTESLPAIQRMVTSLKWQNLGTQLIGSAYDGRDSSLLLWDLHESYEGGLSLRSITVPEEISEVSWASHGNASIVCAAGKCVVHQFHAAVQFLRQETWRSNPAEEESWDFVRCPWWSEESAIIVAASADSASLWIPTKDFSRRNVHAGPITSLEMKPTTIVRPDEHTTHDFATSSLDGTLRMWRYNDQVNELTCIFKVAMDPGHDVPILASSFSLDGSFLAAASYDQLKIWNSGIGGTPVAQWDATANAPEWKGTSEKEQRLQRHHHGGQSSNGIMMENNHDEDHNMDLDVEDLEHTLSWDNEGKNIAFGLGKQVAVIGFNR